MKFITINLQPKVGSISLGFGISGSLAVSYGGCKVEHRFRIFNLSNSTGVLTVWVSGIGQRGSSTGNGHVSSVHTGGRLATKAVKPIGIGVAVTSVDNCWVSLSHTGSNKGTGNNLEISQEILRLFFQNIFVI